jgi:hypothetical protein
MDSQGDEYEEEEEDDFDGIEDVSPSQIVPVVKRSGKEAEKKRTTLADLFSDDDEDVSSEPLGGSARKKGTPRSQSMSLPPNTIGENTYDR